MTTYKMLEKAINAKIDKNDLTETYIDSTKAKMDVFLANDRITIDEYEKLMTLLLAEPLKVE